MAKITAGTNFTDEPAASDVFPFVDISEAADADKRKKITWSVIKSKLTLVFDALYAPIAKGVTNGDTHDHSGGDGAQIAYSSLSGAPAYSTILNTKIVNINDWDMDATASVSVAHGLTASKIRRVSAIVVDDAATNYYQITPRGTFATDVWISYYDVNNVYLGRGASPGGFDSTDFNATSYNRGWVVIEYID